VYQTKVKDVNELRRRTTAACETVKPVTMQNTWREAEYRVDVCRATKGVHVEIYRGTSKLGNFMHLSVVTVFRSVLF
jgi:hypothetical protein